MMKQSIFSKNAPAAIGPYSQAIRIGNFVFLSGQLGINPQTGNFISDLIVDQTKQTFKNIQTLLNAANLTLEDVVKTTLFLSDMSDFSLVNEVYANYFTSPYPARSAVAAKTLPKNALIEMEVIAYKE